MTDKKRPCPSFGSLQPQVEDVLAWGDLTPEDFRPAGAAEKAAFFPPGRGSSYWRDAWRRFRGNRAALGALAVLTFLVLFAFAGPLVVPYGYAQFHAGAENLHPWHYTLADQEHLEAELTRRAGAADPEVAVEQALSEAEARGEALTAVDLARIRAEARAAAQGQASEAQVRRELGIQPRLGGYSREELERKAAGEAVFPHLFGTDRYGRDILVRVMVGTRVSMQVGLSADALVLVIGALYGSISGYCGGKVDAVMQRIVEIIYTIPEVLIILLLGSTLKPIFEEFQNSGDGFLQSMVTLLGANLISIFITFGLLYWVTMSRLIRGQILQLKQQEYVTAARALGASGGRIIKRHLLPNCIGQIVTTTFLQIPSAIFTESFLSFLGMGVSAPMTSLGSMCSDALGGLNTYPYRLFIPAAILSLMILCLNLFGDGLRDALDPRLKK